MRPRDDQKAVAEPARDRYIRFMTKQVSKRSSSNGTCVSVKRAGGVGKITTRLDNITVSGKKPSAALVETNVARSTQALERVGKKLTRPGVHLPEKKGVPRYSADENKPGIFIRRLNGDVTTGRLQNGQFVETK